MNKLFKIIIPIVIAPLVVWWIFNSTNSENEKSIKSLTIYNYTVTQSFGKDTISLEFKRKISFKYDANNTMDNLVLVQRGKEGKETEAAFMIFERTMAENILYKEL